MAKYITCHRRGTAEQWDDNSTIIPLEGEIVIEIDEQNFLHKLKIGDGIHTYAELAYLSAGGSNVVQPLIRAAHIELPSSDWQKPKENDNRWYQEVNVIGTTIQSNDKVDLQPNSEQLAIFHEKDLAFVAENDDGTVFVYCVGQAPTNDYTIQCTVTEVIVNG